MLEAKGLGHLPKCLAPVAGRPFLSYICDYLHDQGIKKIVLCARAKDSRHWMQYRKTAFGSKKGEGVGIAVSWEEEPLGTGGALYRALPLFDSDPVLVLNGDTICKFDLSSILEDFNKDPYYHVLTMKSNGKAAGVWLLSKWFIEYGKDNLHCIDSLQSVLDGNIQTWLRDPAACGRSIEVDHFLDIGTPENYELAESFLRDQGMIDEQAT